MVTANVTAARKTARGALRAVVALALVGMLGGCRPSDELIEVIYDQQSDIIDYNTDQKNYVASEDGEVITDSRTLEAFSQNDDALETVDMTIPVFGNPANSTTPIEQVLYDANSSLMRSAPIFTDTPQNDDEDSEEDDEEQDDNDGAGTNYDPNALSPSVSDNGSEGDDGDGNGDDSDAGPQESDDTNTGVNDRGPTVENPSGNLIESLDVKTVATVGEYANLAMMLGGKGVLVASDTGFLGSAAAQRVFGAGDWGFASIVPAWTYDAEAGTYAVDFDVLVETAPDIVLIPDGIGLLSAEQEAQLREMGVYVQSMPQMNTVDRIKQAARWLGESLGVSESTGVDAVARANSYIDNYLERDVNALISENGGLTSSRLSSFGNDAQASSYNSTANWTIFVTDWDYAAVFDATSLVNPWTARGVAIARSGYGWSPLNFYLSAGGVENNAALFPNTTLADKNSESYYIWQFNMSMLNPNLVMGWTKSTGSFGATPYGWSQCLTGAPATVDGTGAFQTSLGQSDFRYMICANQEIANVLAAQRDYDTATQTGLYAAYNYNVGEALQESGVGPRLNGGVLVRSFIGGGTLGGGNGEKSYGQLNQEQGLAVYEVVSCGNGLYCDWINGSVESFLMAFWADDLYDGDTSFSNLRQEASAFYSEFYGYTLTEDDFNTICNGRAN